MVTKNRVKLKLLLEVFISNSDSLLPKKILSPSIKIEGHPFKKSSARIKACAKPSGFG